MAARVMFWSSVLRLGQQDLLVSSHGVDHLGLIVVPRRDFRTLMPEHRHGQPHICPVVDGGAGREARPEQMGVDRLAESLAGPLADHAVERVAVQRLTVSSEPQPTYSPVAAEQWPVMVNIAVYARRGPIGQNGEMRPAIFHLLARDVDAPCGAVLDQSLANLKGSVGAAERVGSANTALEIGQTLVKDGATWSIDIPGEEMKNRRPHLAVLPDWATPCIDRYVDHYWPLLGGDEAVGRLWLGANGQPLNGDALYRMICKRTREAFGKPINPHLFRSCLATSTAVHHGAYMGLAMTVLGHQSSKVTTRHYNQAKMIDAVRAYQEVLLAEPQD